MRLFRPNIYEKVEKTLESNIDIGKDYSLQELLRMFNRKLAKDYDLFAIGSDCSLRCDLQKYIDGNSNQLDIKTIQRILAFARDYHKQLGFSAEPFIKYADSNEKLNKSDSVNLLK